MIPGNLKPAPGSPQFRWNSVARRYVDKRGRFVSVKRVRNALDTFIDVQTAAMKAASQQLVDGNITLGAWQKQMTVMVKDVNLAGASIERGGWYQMNASDFGRAGQKIRGEYAYLENFAAEIASGQQRLDGTLWSRATLYGEQGRVTYHDFARASAEADRMDEERSRLSPADHCDECVSENNKGWQPFGTLVAVGDRQCLSRCHCYMSYRNSITGASRTV